MNRRAQHQWNLAALILLAAAVIIAVMLLLAFSGAWRSSMDCSAEVRSHAVVARVSKDLVDPSAIRCPTNVIRASGEEANAAIAGEMLRCWEQWGRGELRLFGDQEGTYCHVCGMVYVDAPEVRGLFEYLKEERTRDGRTYLEALAPTATGDSFAGAAPLAEAVLPTERPIGVIFTYAKGTDAVTRLVSSSLGEPGVGLSVGAIAGGGVVWLVAPLLPAGPVGWVAGGAIVTGSALAGAISSYLVRAPLDTLAVVTARPLDPIGLGGCDYAPVES